MRFHPSGAMQTYSMFWNSYGYWSCETEPLRAPGRCCFRGLSMRLVSLWWELPPWLTSNT